MELVIQKYLRSGHTLQELESDYGIEHTIRNNKVSLNYNMIHSPMNQVIVRECRGLILREGTWEIVAFPFKKFSNFGETYADVIDWTTAKYYEKIDGTLIILYFDIKDNCWYTATRSQPEAILPVAGTDMSFSKLFALALTKQTTLTFNKYVKLLNSNNTYMFEVTSPFNAVVVQQFDLNVVFIGARNNITLEEYNIDEFANSVLIPSAGKHSFNIYSDALSFVQSRPPVTHEGIVVCDHLFNRVKIKSDAYKAAHGLIGSMSASDRNIIKVILLGCDNDVITMITYQPLLDKIQDYKNKIKLIINAIEKQYALLSHIESDKEFALLTCKTFFPAALFALRRKKYNNATSFITNNANSTNGIDKLLNLTQSINTIEYIYDSAKMLLLQEDKINR